MSAPTINEMVSAASAQAREHEGSAATCYSRAKQDRLAEVFDAAAETLKRMQWQPIETAPKDGPAVLFSPIQDGGNFRDGLIWISGGKGVLGRWRGDYGKSEPALWMPLEALPAIPTQDAET